MNTMKPEGCPLCRSKDVAFKGEIDYIKPVKFSTIEISLDLIPELWSCRSCKSGFTSNIVSEDVARRLYSEGLSGQRWSNEVFEVAKGKEVVDALGALFRKGIRVLDVGCNVGVLLDFAKSRECETAGVEYSTACRRVVEGKGHMFYRTMDEAGQGFDVITAFDLVEHLYDPLSFFNDCQNRLRDGGAMVVLTGNISCLSSKLSGAKWWYLKYPEHIVFPSRRYFSLLPGFRLEAWIRTYASVAYKRPLLESLKRFGVEFTRGQYMGLPSLGGDHTLVVLRK